MRQARIVVAAVILAATFGAAFAAEETAGNVDAAIGIYEGIIEAEEARRPYLAEAHLRLGLCYLKQDKPQKARAAFALPAVRADRGALITVLLNLLENAYKYTGERKEIALCAYADEGWVSFEVSDNGIGILRRDRRRIFERFYQVDRSLSTSGGGCGLGLAIVKFIVDAHTGSVEVAERAEGGSIFTVRLPIFDRPKREAQ